MSSVSLMDRIRWTLKHEGFGALFAKAVRGVLRPKLFSRTRPYNYEEYRLSDDLARAVQRRVSNVRTPPLISVILPVYNPRLHFLQLAVDSVRSQSYPHWQLCIADDCSTKPEVRDYLGSLQELDERIEVCFREQNGHISESSNSALELAKGEFVALLDHDDMLAEHALLLYADHICRFPEVDIIYSNEDKIDAKGNHSEPAFKPAWSPEYFLSFMYIGHLTAHRTNLVREVGGFRKGFEGSQDYDLALRVSEMARSVIHIPEILYHWRMHEDSVAGNIKAKPYAFDAAKQAIRSALSRRGLEHSIVSDTKQPGIYWVRYALTERPSLLVLLTVAKEEFSLDRVRRIIEGTTYEHIIWRLQLEENLARHTVQPLKELVVELSRGGLDIQLLESAEKKVGPEIRAELLAANADYLALLSSRVCPRNNDWPQCMLEIAAQAQIGMVGGHIITEAGDHVHAGYVYADSKLYHHMYGVHHAEAGYGARLTTINNVSSLSSMAVVISRDTFLQSKAAETIWQKQESFELALGLELLGKEQRLVFTPTAVFTLEGEAIPRSVLLTDSLADWSLLCTEFDVEAFQDPYYPQGLLTSPPEYQPDLESILARRYLDLSGRTEAEITAHGEQAA